MPLGKRTDELVVSDLGEMISRKPPTVQKSASIGQAIDVLLTSSHPDRLYVIDIEGNLVGTVTGEAIMRMVGHKLEMKESATKTFFEAIHEFLEEGVEQVIHKPMPIMSTTTLTVAISLMKENCLTELPVVDDDYKLIGELSFLELLASAALPRNKEP